MERKEVVQANLMAKRESKLVEVEELLDVQGVEDLQMADGQAKHYSEEDLVEKTYFDDLPGMAQVVQEKKDGLQKKEAAIGDCVQMNSW